MPQALKEKWKLYNLWYICTRGNLLDELSSTVASLHQQMSPGRQLLGRIHSEHMGLHALLGAWTQAKRQLRVEERRRFSWARVNQSNGEGRWDKNTAEQKGY